MLKQEIEQPPLLYFLLQYKKYSQIAKIILNQSLSSSILKEYGWERDRFSQYEEHKIEKSVNNFTISELLEIKGSSKERTKFYENRILIQMIKRKAKKELVSPETRKVLWIQFTDIYQKKNLYANLGALETTPDFLEIIDKDLNRTQVAKGVKEKAREVLTRFAIYNPYIGYCQGMNHIVAFLLEQNLSCEETFFVMKRLTQKILPCDYYSQLESIIAYMKIFFELLNYTHPKIYKKMQAIIKSMNNQFMVVLMCTFQWFVCLFTNSSFQKNISRVIMDHLLLQGIVVLFKAGIAIFDQLEEKILEVKTYEQYTKMEKVIATISDEKKILKRIRDVHLSEHIIFLFKERYLEVSKEEKSKESKRPPLKNEVKKCNHRWNACRQTISENFQKQYIYDYFVFKTASPFEIKEDYLEKLNRQYFSSEQPKVLTDTLIIGRMEHLCRSNSETLTEGSLSDKIGKTNSKQGKGYQEEDFELNINFRGDELVLKQNLKTPTKQIPVASEESVKGELQIDQDSQKKIRLKIHDSFKEKVLVRSQSILFMKEMVQNASISSLLHFYDIDEMFQ